MAGFRNSYVWFYSGVPIDSENTLYFKNGNDTKKVFNWFQKYHKMDFFSNVSYQRESRYVRVDLTKIDYEILYTCNWLSYDNTGHENRSIFGRITEIEYINDGVAHVHFSIDYWLSYIDTFKPISGMIDRQHYTNELNPLSLTAMRIEKIDTGDYITIESRMQQLEFIGYVVSYSMDEKGQLLPDSFVDSPTLKYPGLTTRVFTNIVDLRAFVYLYKDHPEGISNITTWYGLPHNITLTLNATPPIDDTIKFPWTKMYKYPSMYLRVTNGVGDEKHYYYEHFHVPGSDNQGRTPPQFKTYSYSIAGQLCQTAIVPLNYKGKAENFEEAFYYDKTPQSQWVGDSYGQWASVNSVRDIFNSALAIGGVLLAPATGGLSLGASAYSLANTAVNHLAKSKESDRLMGSPSYGGLGALAMQRAGFCFDTMAAIPGLQRANNNYFNSYGYLSGHIGLPNFDGNPIFNYVKCNLTFEYGGPSEGHNSIRSMFANGVRLWHEYSEIGDYSQDNRA